MADLKISQLTAKGTAIAATDLVEISESNGAGGYVTKSVTGANILSVGTEIGAQIGGGIVVAVFNDAGVNKALVASLTNLSTSLPWTATAQQTVLIGATAQSLFDGLTNTNAIIAQTGASATTAYAAGISRLFAGGGFSDWYLPALWELNMLYNSAAIVSKVLGSVNGILNGFNYWSSTELSATNSWNLTSTDGAQGSNSKANNRAIRAVRIHTI